MIPDVSDRAPQGLLLAEITPQEIAEKQSLGQSFVLNIVTSWCPDCTLRQAGCIEGFADRVKSGGLGVFQCTVQHERGVFLSEEHEKLTESCGGHGYPRTVLFLSGKLVSQDNVEVIGQQQLYNLADLFLNMATAEEPR